jgi:two-component system chemotaxis response regulator CheB
VANAVDGEKIEAGRVYIGPPDRHLLLDRTSVKLFNGPKENWARPAIDPLFRTAAQFHGPRTIGVVLSGKLDDGSAGLWAIKRKGGFTVVQSPSDALAPDMPNHALAAVEVDAIADAEEIGLMLSQWCRSQSTYAVRDASDKLIELENAALLQQAKGAAVMGELGTAAGVVCPDCGGQLWQVKEGPLRFRCHAGHGYSAHSLLDGQGREIERVGWAYVRTLEEDVELLQRILDSADKSLRERVEARLRQTLGKLERVKPLVLDSPLDVSPNTAEDEASLQHPEESQKIDSSRAG